MRLVVGLGNPGKKYERTRHNAGFWWVEKLADNARANLRGEGKFHGRVAKLSGPSEIWLLLPETFMNDSGRAVAALASFYKVAPQEILVVHDELDLAPGVAKLKLGGGASGHNGLKDIIDCLGSRDFWRLRLGIGHPGIKSEVANYVLRRPPLAEHELVHKAIDASLDALGLLLEGDMERAMMKIHAKPPRPKPPRPPDTEEED